MARYKPVYPHPCRGTGQALSKMMPVRFSDQIQHGTLRVQSRLPIAAYLPFTQPMNLSAGQPWR